MKCLSVRQPHASRIASGQKTLEIRTWSTRYRGPLIICASSQRDRRFRDLPSGVTVCVVDLIDIRDFTDSDSAAACFDFEPGDDFFAWVLSDPRPLPAVSVKGRLGLFPPSDSLLNSLRAMDASING